VGDAGETVAITKPKPDEGGPAAAPGGEVSQFPVSGF